MTDQHTITPPPKLVEWLQDLGNLDAIALAYQAGADQELEACCEYLVRCAQWEPEDVDELRAARRPKPPSLKEQALEVVTGFFHPPSYEVWSFSIPILQSFFSQ